ncbi:LPXTG cell wall anchor domain-containing protein [Cellulosilyticum sp. I15G10I2]|uniref:LPXTG cell wall anchor domain-containing protein n=1 Tax=Cellulosilyticum sp. I15G10I2 TaxID=1892843 RepID=UPI00085C3C13|nr:LPXTG cell wall anchor domain-containing protein [Cellulosilyticum sp. I15G10I2]
MKRKKSKLIGLALIISAILLQVAYAATVTGVARDENYEIKLHCEVGEKSEYLNVTVKADESKGGVMLVGAGNLYPGAFFVIDSVIENLGGSIKLESVEIKPTGEGNQELYRNLIFYDEKDNEITVDQYKSYLVQQHADGIIGRDETKKFRLKIGLSPEVTELENESTEFLIEIKYVQAVIDTGGGTGDNENPNSGGPETPGNTTGPDDTTIPDEIIPAGPTAVELIDEDIPGGDTDIDLVDETIPGGPAKLPKTGGVGALLVYALGLTMLGGGVSLYRKGKKEE